MLYCYPTSSFNLKTFFHFPLFSPSFSLERNFFKRFLKWRYSYYSLLAKDYCFFSCIFTLSLLLSFYSLKITPQPITSHPLERRKWNKLSHYGMMVSLICTFFEWTKNIETISTLQLLSRHNWDDFSSFFQWLRVEQIS